MLLVRPRYHHTPPDGWMNDPVGLFRKDGVWHLHYQRAVDKDFRAMGWGLATSSNLLIWEAGEDALAPDPDGWIYSGSVVTDADMAGSSIAAFYTRHDPHTGHQSQEIALHNGEGAWSRPAPNPLVDEGRGETRDPFVFAFGEEWRMIVAEPVAWTSPEKGRSHFAVYASRDLLAWDRCGDLGVEGKPGVMFETPVLKRLPVEGMEHTEWPWLLLAGVIDRNGDGACCGTQAWLGAFDGSRFQPHGEPVALDYGPDYYAPSAWAGTGDELVVTAWVNSWAYARALPGDGWIGGAHALPRQVRGQVRDGKVEIIQRPKALPEGRPLGEAGHYAGHRSMLVEAKAPFTILLNAGTASETRLDVGEDAVELLRGPGETGVAGFDGHWAAPIPAGPARLEAIVLIDGCVLALFAGPSVAVTALVEREADFGVDITGANVRVVRLDG